MTLRIAIAGIHGRMGQMLQQCVVDHTHTTLTLGTVRYHEHNTTINPHDSQVPLSDNLAAHTETFDVLIDFTTPEATLNHLAICANANKGMVIGTTGFNVQHKAQLTHLSTQIPIVFASNMSYGVNLCFYLLSQLGKAMKNERVDIEVVDIHHRHKKDAPSGTALAMGEAVAKGMGIDLPSHARYHRQGVRENNTIGFQSLRGGDVIGDHSVIFALDGERIEITHKASTRRIYADGAIKAACWLQKQSQAGLYTMQDVIMQDVIMQESLFNPLKADSIQQ